MRILVAVKRVVDYNVKIKIKSDESGIETAYLKMSMNPFDEIALEEGLRLKDSDPATEIIAVTIGPEVCQETLRAALALGVDRAILLKTDETMQPLAVAKLLRYIAEQENPDLVILGKQAIDDDNNQTGQMLAALLDWPQGTFISKLTLLHNIAEIVREIDGGLETLQLELPAVLTTDLRLNTPRYATLPNIMKAKTKPISIQEVSEIIKKTALNLSSHFRILKVSPPNVRKSGVLLSNATQLVETLISDKIL